jgi:hypothetical protein
MSTLLFLNLFLSYQTINLPFNFLNDGKTLYGTGDEIISHYLEFHQTMNLIELMETNQRLMNSGIKPL